MEVESHDLYGDISREEAINRYPEVMDIRNETLRETTIGVIREMPDYHWTAPASTRHHPPEHRQRHGLWLHVKRVCTKFERQATSMVKQGHLEWKDVDYGRAACILHDMFKYGVPPTSVDGTVNNHDTLAADWLSDHTQLPDEVIDAVEQHNGPWYTGDMPDSHLAQMVHVADLHGSDENSRVAVKDPHPVLEDQFPRVGER
jgi:hypothetical protein